MSTMRMSRRDFLRARVAPRVEAPMASAAATAAPRAESAAPRPPFDRRAHARAALPKLPLLARVDRFACLASTGQVCTVCVEHCPAPGALRLDPLVPVVDAALCTGCGACEPVCPAPLGAIRVLPNLDALKARPT